MSKKREEYIEDSTEMKAKKKQLLGGSNNYDNIPRADSLGVKVDEDFLEGKKIHIDDIINCDIVVFDAKIEKSKFVDDRTGMSKNMLIIQFGMIEENLESTYVVFTGSRYLMDYIKQFKESDNQFPFRTKITKHGKSYKFG